MKIITLAKEKGFVSQVIGKSAEAKYTSHGDLFFYLWMCELQKWLREKHNIHVCIESGFDTMLKYNRGYCLTINGENIWNNNDCFEQYEQALEKGLQEALKLIEL